MYKPSSIVSTHKGTQRLYKFANGYGASVINHQHSYGIELAVIKWDLKVIPFDWDLVYNTPVTDNVITYMTLKQVEKVLACIEKLTPEGKDPIETSS